MRPVDALSRHASSWGWLVTVSAFALLTAGLVMAVWWAATDEERTSTYQVRGSVTAITLDIGEADLQIVGGGSQAALQVSHTDRYAFGHPAETERIVADGELRLRSRCPAALLGRCSFAYRVLVPDNVPVKVRTTSGDVTLRGYRGSAHGRHHPGAIDIDGYCGNRSTPAPTAGDVRAVAACAPPRLPLRSRAGVGPRARRRPAATTSTPRATSGKAQRARHHRPRRRAVPGPGAQRLRRRPRRERRRDRARSSSTAASTRAGHAVAYLVGQRCR